MLRCLVNAGLGNVAYRDLDDVIVAGIFLHALDVRLPLPTDADVRNQDSVIRPDDAPGRRRLVLFIDGCLENVGRGDDSRGGSRLFDEVPAGLGAGR